ncbi:MAG: sugar transferase [Sulfurimonas sp.]
MSSNKRKSSYAREMKAKIILFVFDLLAVFISLIVGFILANIFNLTVGFSSSSYLNHSINYAAIYLIVPMTFFFEGIYSYRFDFWHELRLILKALLLSLIVILAYMEFTKYSGGSARSVLILSILSMMIIIPWMKNILKKKLFDIGWWKLGVKILSENTQIDSEIFNYYLGYIKSSREEASIVFLDVKNKDVDTMKKELEREIGLRNKVMFLPVFNNYQFTSNNIFELNNSRTNLIVLQNKLNSEYRMFINTLYNYVLAILLLPLLLPILGIIAILIKLDSKGPVFFMQDRLGKNGKVFSVYKFRTMHINGDELIKEYLKDNPQEVENYHIYCKYENDPRITKIGRILRNTSADELAQIFNVLKGEMNFMGPRPYMTTEADKIGLENVDIVLKVKPGITGLWQVSGRNDLTFDERVELDRWYIYNWSLWMDFVIFFQTINVVLNRSGAK